LVEGPAFGTVVGYDLAGAGWEVLRVVRCRGAAQPAATGRAGSRARPRDYSPGNRGRHHGRRFDVANPKHLASRLRKLHRLEREKHRRMSCSSNRTKTRHKVAILHGKVARARRDYQHKQALASVRDNQAVYVEDLNIIGMVRNHRLARAIHDAGWSQFVRLIEEKAEYHGRTVLKVSRWLPSSKTCSGCGHVADAMPLRIREWACLACGEAHDRDHNAARNILAAGRAERGNACGALVRPSTEEARGDETGSSQTWRPGGNPRPRQRARQVLLA